MKTHMLSRMVLLSSILLSARMVTGQSIIAGEHGANDHYVDVDPDGVYAGSDWEFGPWGYDAIDLNGNGTTDVELYAVYSGGMVGHTCTVYAMSLSGVRFASDGMQCGDTAARPFEAGEMIDISADWSTSPVRMAYTSIFQGETTCYFNSFGVGAYLGTQLIQEQDTLYGWIRVGSLVSPSFTVFEHACNTAASAIPANANKAGRFFYDAERRELDIRLVAPATDTWSVELCDMRGTNVMVRPGPKGVDRLVLAVDDLATGVYALAVRCSSGVLRSGRFVVAR